MIRECEVPGCEEETAGHPVQPDWYGYEMCAACIREYEARRPAYTREHYAANSVISGRVYDQWMANDAGCPYAEAAEAPFI